MNEKKKKFKKSIIELVPPKITPFEFARDVNVNDRVSVQCVVGTGDLPLTFTWLKDDVPIVSTAEGNAASSTSDVHATTKNAVGRGGHESPIMIRQNDEFTSALSISSIARSQGGTYKCIVENDAAKETYAAVLRVNGNRDADAQQSIENEIFEIT